MENRYKKLLQKIIAKGILRENRTGVRTYCLFNQTFSYDIDKYFPLITGRKMFAKNCIYEFLWILSGSTNISFLQDNNVHIWDDWANSNGEVGPLYGKQLLDFNGINQLESVIGDIKSNPMSRRHIISLWNPKELGLMVLPPCYFVFQFYIVQDTINMSAYQRSSDSMMGLPYDIAVFSLLLTYIGKETGYMAKNVTIFISDLHLYTEHLDAYKTYIAQPTQKLPTLAFNSLEDINIINYNPGIFINLKKII